MILRLFTTPLLAATLVLSTLGCATKADDPTPPTPTPASGTGSYTVDGLSVTCKATFYKSSTNTGLDYLLIYLVTTPEPSTGPKKLTLTFTKRPSEPVSAYETAGAYTSLANINAATLYGPQPYTVAATSSGGISGTFSAITPPTDAVKSVITNGVFTDVHP